MTLPDMAALAGIGIVIVGATAGIVLAVRLFALRRAKRVASSAADARVRAAGRKRVLEEEARRQGAAEEREAMVAQLATRREALAKRRAEASRPASQTVPAQALPQVPLMASPLAHHQVSMPEVSRPEGSGTRRSSALDTSRTGIGVDDGEPPSVVEDGGQGSERNDSAQSSQTWSELGSTSDDVRTLGSGATEPGESLLALDARPALANLISVPNEPRRELSSTQSSEATSEATSAKAEVRTPKPFAVEPCEAPLPADTRPTMAHSVPVPSERRENICSVQASEAATEPASTSADVQTLEAPDVELGEPQFALEAQPAVGLPLLVPSANHSPPKNEASGATDNAAASWVEPPASLAQTPVPVLVEAANSAHGSYLVEPSAAEAAAGKPTDHEVTSTVAEVASEAASPGHGGPTNLASHPEGTSEVLSQAINGTGAAFSVMHSESSDSPRERADVVWTSEAERPGHVVSVDPAEAQGNDVLLQPESDPPAGHQRLEDVAASVPEDDTLAPKQRRYRMSARNSTQARPPQRQVPSRTVDRGAPVDVRLSFGRDGRCTVSLVPRRTDAMSATATVSRRGQDLELIEMQEGWYEDVFIEDLGAELKSGVSWEGRSNTGERFRWSLGGRDVFVLATHSQLSGFVDTNRLELNERHVVLCTEEIETAVQAVLTSAGAVGTLRLTNEQGAPLGWIAIRNVIPRRVIEPPAVADSLDCLRPVADAELTLEEGIRVVGNSWLAGFPPNIRIRGDAAMVGEVRIDGKVAIPNTSGAFQSEGWDGLGSHFVACSVGTATYVVVEPERDWRSWAAHNWTMGEDETKAKLADRPSVCGALVVAPATRSTTSNSVVVPLTNSVVLGASPDEMEVCKPMRDRTSKHCVGFPAFRPVWALPLDAMHCDKKTSGVIFLAPALIPAPSRAEAQRMPLHSGVLAWCSAILSASRKGLTPTSNDPAVLALWMSYRDIARLLRRRQR